MALRRLLVLVLAWVVLLAAGRAWAYTPPKLTGAVNDGASMLSTAERETLEAKIAEHRKAHGFEIVVLTVPSLAGEGIEDVAYGAFNGWKIGRAGKDDGVLLVVAPNERKTRIETGKGVGGAITDLQSKRILSERVGPRLKEGKAYEALRDGVDSIASLLLGGPLVPDGGAEDPPSAPTTPKKQAPPTPTYAPESYFVDASGKFSAAERARYVKAAEARVSSGKAAAAVVVVPDDEPADLPSIAGWNEASFRKGLHGVFGIVIVRRGDGGGFGYGSMEATGPGRDTFESVTRGLKNRVAPLPAASRDAAIVDVLIEAQAALDVPIPGFFARHEEVIMPFLVIALVFVAIAFFTWLSAKLGRKGGGSGDSGGGSSYGGSSGGSSYGGGSSGGGYSGGSSGGGYSGGGGSSGGGGASDSY